ncbi:EF-hand [Dissoconium aciculare CBS 342.82]|uniref:Calmodulin n=1 Tax=Dissoconium aciculare CBS 342.82 TaxID=1314786 RepID=A0A6J3LXG2_9PEZI|nr:EF-hand [Dissoconium aciculare CBS 342.82]KAF1819984.1 EF-hand [Dissoconium aciculare CBS 342.82]
MAPKRKQASTAAATASSSKTPAKRRSKLAKEHDLTAEEELEIQETFALFSRENDDFADTKEGVIATNDVRRCLIALNAPPRDNAELQELIETVDPEDSGWIPYEHFVAIAALKIHARHDDEDDNPDAVNEEVAKAYRLFTKGEDRAITMADLRRVAKELREEIPENVLKDMVREATGGGLGPVEMDDFEDVMRRAGVIR